MYKSSEGFLPSIILCLIVCGELSSRKKGKEKMCSQQPITLMPFLGKRKAVLDGAGSVKKPLDIKVIKYGGKLCVLF